MNTEKNVVMQRELFIIDLLRKGYSRKYVAAKVQEQFGLAESTCRDIVNQIGAKINKGLDGLKEDAAQYIYNTLLSTIDEKDRKNRIRALELLAKVCRVGATDEKTDVHINFGFSFSDTTNDVDGISE